VGKNICWEKNDELLNDRYCSNRAFVSYVSEDLFQELHDVSKVNLTGE
jgi:hypothetical protein